MLHRLTTVIKMMPPIPIPLSCPASSVKQILCPAARDSSLVIWLFSPFHQPGSRGRGFTGGKRLHNVMETSKREKQKGDRPGPKCKGEVGIMRPDLSQERTTDLYLHFLPPLSFLLPYNNKEKRKRQWEGRKVGSSHIHRGIQGREREHITIGREKMIKDWDEHNLLVLEENGRNFQSQ